MEWHDSFRTKIDGIAEKMNMSFVEFRHPIDLQLDIPARAEGIKKIRLWALLIGVFFSLGMIGSAMDPGGSTLFELVFAIVTAAITYSVWLWCQSSLKYLRVTQIASKRLIESKPELASEMKEMQANFRASSMSPVTGDQPASAQQIKELQKEMLHELFVAGEREARGDVTGAGIARGRAAVIESKLRGLGH